MRRILVIDDEQSIRTIISLLLREMGYCVEAAENGKEGIEIFHRDGDFDLVITDIRMPKMDGNQVARHIRTSARPKTPLVAVAGPVARRQRLRADVRVALARMAHGVAALVGAECLEPLVAPRQVALGLRGNAVFGASAAVVAKARQWPAARSVLHADGMPVGVYALVLVHGGAARQKHWRQQPNRDHTAQHHHHHSSLPPDQEKSASLFLRRPWSISSHTAHVHGAPQASAC